LRRPPNGWGPHLGTCGGLVIERRIAYRKLGRYVRFHPDDLAEYMAAHRVEAGQYRGAD
jgi:hypothetical protein